MSSIRVLPDTLVNKIAAGEVVERPASVVKELIENSLDAGASDVLVDIEKAGKRLIRITDNGRGMDREDAALAFERHATSKVRSETDLDAITTLGFRGEALASIASVSQVRMLTAERGASSGVLIEIDGGSRKAAVDAASPPGTSIEVRHLFFNTPARLKFLKSDATELSHIIAAVSRQAMAHPAIRFRLTHDRKTIFELPQGTLRERVFQIFGSELAEGLMAFEGSRAPAAVHGLIGRPGTDRGDRTYQEFYVNGRYIRNASLTHALYEAYRDLVMRDRHPVGFVFLDIDPSLVDVNVHPAKAEVRFRSQSQVHDLVRDIVREALRGPAATADTPAGGPAGRAAEAVAGYLAAAGGSHPEPHLFGRRRSDRTAPLSGHQVPERPDADAPGQMLAPVPDLSPEQLVPLSQVHNSFIIAQYGSGMAIIDQHAAHERVLFERLQDEYEKGDIPVQDLLLPLQLELGHAERGLLEELLPWLRRFGFHVEPFSGGTFIVKAVPALMAGGDHKRLLLDILDEVRAHGSITEMDRIRDELLSVMACHPAIKVHRKLTPAEMEGLLRDLASCRMPHSCPHGRPTVVRFTMDEIRRMFKRT